MKYVIIEADEVSNVDFSQVVESDPDKLRVNSTTSQRIVKFEGDTPSFLEGKTQHSHSEILEVLSASEWNPE